METNTMEAVASGTKHKVVTPQEWLHARKQLLQKEKELTHLYDSVRAERLKLPWTEVTKNYVFDGPNGKETLADLFEGRSQLIVQHFMFGPGWKEGCVGCSFGADHAQAALVHLNNHDVSYVAVSRAPIEEIESFKKRMGWTFKWVSSFNNDFNFDFHVSFRPEDIVDDEVFYNYQKIPFLSEELSGDSAFYKDEHGNIFHTYSTYARGGESKLTTYMLLDIAPKGRNEGGPGNLTNWVRHHDKYNAGGYVSNTGRYVAESNNGSCCHAEEHQYERR
ncbi:MAG TPA: thioredoxin family protein [Parafilimonas sp.]|nr:thioredoxin family protein [Parafilimonas sp.]